MVEFEWEPEYSVGHAEIDLQHQSIIAVMNRLYALLKADTEPRQAEIEGVFDELARYVSTHFAYEELLMLRVGYPAEKLSAHKLLHNELLARAQAIMAAHLAGEPEALPNLLAFLHGDWLIEHICDKDHDFSSHIAAYSRRIDP
jgi:hemerythrin